MTDGGPAGTVFGPVEAAERRICSVVIPVYRNEPSLAHLLAELATVSDQAGRRFGIVMEFVFVVDGSPDRCHALLRQMLPLAPFPSQLVSHARNFGSFSAIRTGLRAGRGAHFACIAADLQEPPGLLLDFLQVLLRGEHDVVVGVREARADPAASRLASNLFWRMYRACVMRDMPRGGVDVFGCTSRVRDALLQLRESNSSLIGLLFWLGFRRDEVRYARRARAFGRSGWTFGRKVQYLLDSVFAFSDLPIRILAFIGVAGVVVAMMLGGLVAVLRLLGDIDVPGYAAVIVAVMFFGALNTIGLALIGAYAWRAYENTKQRPLAVVESQQRFAGAAARERAA